MFKKDPDGYRKLLAYQKAQSLHNDVLELVSHFPKTKTYNDLADQMARSVRSTNKNTVEGWKRTTTKEYFDFLSFSVGSNSELKDDAADIVCGKYKELMGIKGVMGERGGMGNTLYPFGPFNPITLEQLDKIPFYPLDETLPPAVKIYLKAKEVNYLLYKLQQSLDVKMDNEHTKPLSEKVRNRFKAEASADQEFQKYLQSLGLERLENGKMVSSNSNEH
jgi:hypothetical protein